VSAVAMMHRSAVVVVIEDDPAALTALSRVISASGLEPAPYRTAEAYLAAPPALPQRCLVVDLRLPGMSGLDLKRRLAAMGSTIPTIVMTSFEEPRVREQALRLGCVGYFDKSCEVGELLATIRECQ
jgi:FixJ family two-component response regulator